MSQLTELTQLTVPRPTVDLTTVPTDPVLTGALHSALALAYGEADPPAENINSTACLAAVVVCVEASHSIARCLMSSSCPALTTSHVCSSVS